MSVNIRPIQLTDLPVIMEIETLVYPFPWTLAIFQDCLRTGYELWLLEQAGQIMGYGIMSTGAREAHILNICVHPRERQQGYGRLLLTHLLKLAQQQQIEMVFLEVRYSNQVAVNLYLQLGFNQIGLRKRYYPALSGREDALIFALDLTILQK